MNTKEKFVAKTYAGLEEILLEELEQLGAENCKLSTRAVLFEGDMDTMYRANYYCRYALRILWQVGTFTFRDNKQFYEEIYKYPAEKMLKSDGTLAFSVTMKDSIFATPLFAAQLAMDAVCDRFREVCAEGARLMIDLIEKEDQRDCKTILLKPVLYPGNTVRSIDADISNL